jgi:hypothetical protein
VRRCRANPLQEGVDAPGGGFGDAQVADAGLDLVGEQALALFPRPRRYPLGGVLTEPDGHEFGDGRGAVRPARRRRVGGEKKQCLEALVKVELLVIDDWFLAEPTRQQVQAVHTLVDRRHRVASTIFCAQLAPGQWHDRMQEKILADAIVDRITTNAHATVLDCDESMLKQFNQLGG